MSKIIVAGGRDFVSYKSVKKTLDPYKHKISEIVSGKAAGADSLGEHWANENEIHVEPFPADWDHYGNGAGPVRNKQMAEYADALIAFWDGESSGTEDMIKQMESLNKPVKVIHYDKEK